MKEESRNFTVRLPTMLLEEIQAIADVEDRTLSGQIKKILREYLRDRHKRHVD